MKLVIVSCLIFCMTSLGYAALYDPPDGPEPPTYSIGELSQMVNWLEDYYGACTVIFEQEGGAIDLCREAKAFTKLMETQSIQLLVNNPTYNASQWSDAVFAAYAGWFSSSHWSEMFAELTQVQLNVLLYKVMYWNPTEDPTETRTFAEFKTWVLAQ